VVRGDWEGWVGIAGFSRLSVRPIPLLFVSIIALWIVGMVGGGIVIPSGSFGRGFYGGSFIVANGLGIVMQLYWSFIEAYFTLFKCARLILITTFLGLKHSYLVEKALELPLHPARRPYTT